MVEQKKSTKPTKHTTATIDQVSFESAILAHKFTCPYYSIRGIIKTHNPDSERQPSKEIGHCGAESVWTQQKGETQCEGKCWYMKHFLGLLKGLK